MKKKFVKFNEYIQRDKYLKEIGFDSYKDYLKSDLWKKIREDVFKNKPNRCHFCHATEGLQVHHRQYYRDILLGQNIKPLEILCGKCHKNIEFHDNFDKKRLYEANRKFRLARKMSIEDANVADKIKPDDDYSKILKDQGFNDKQISDYVEIYKSYNKKLTPSEWDARYKAENRRHYNKRKKNKKKQEIKTLKKKRQMGTITKNEKKKLWKLTSK